MDIEATREEIKQLEALQGKGESVWETLNPLRASLSDYLRPTCEVGFSGHVSTQEVHPSTIKVGDTLYNAGFLGKVDEIIVHDYSKHELPVYVFKLVYVSGDLSMFRWFIESINNGCNKDHRAHEQGNELDTFLKLRTGEVK